MSSLPADNWQTLNVGAGGWLTGIDIAPDDTMVVRTDTYGAYIWNGTEWQQLVTATSMPANFVNPGAIAQGVYEIQVASSDSNILYMMDAGDVFRSTDKGATWTQTNFAHVTEDPNDPYRMNGQKMAVDPNNPDVVYVGTPKNGMFVTTDGGVTWNSVSSVPGSLPDANGLYPGITGLAFDPTSGVAGGKTNTIYASSYGNGVFESTDGGGSWTKLVGGPSNVEYATVSGTGSYYAAGDNNSDLWRFANGVWTELLSKSNLGGNPIETVAVDPFNPNHIIITTPGGNLDQTLNGGVTWSGWNWNSHLSATDVPWLADTGPGLSVGGVAFDQLVPNKLWASAGVGVWDTSVPHTILSNTPITWTSQSIGIEQLNANQILVAPGGTPILASWDRSFVDVTDPSTYASSYGPIDGKFAAGWSLDYASSKPSFVVGIADWWGREESGYSTDGGQTWNLFPTMPSFAGKTIGGSIAASSPTDIVWAPADGFDPVYTKDGGLTWNPVVLPGVTDYTGFDFAYYLEARTVTADRVLADTFYLYDAGQGVYRSTDGGATWTQVFSGQISPFSNFNAELESVPGEAGNLFFTGGPQGTGSKTAPSGEKFYQSTDGGATWVAVPNVQEVKTFGFGAPANPGGYPSIYIVGWVNSVYGIWQSNDDAKSWTQIGTYPTDSLDNIRTISGDPNTYGQVYVGFSGSGYAYLPAASNTTPTITIAYSPDTGQVGDGFTNATVLTLSGTAGAGSTIKVYDGSTLLGTATADASGAWNFATAKLASGAHAFTATATDLAGNTGTPSSVLTVTVDTIAPVAPTIASFAPDTGPVGDGITTATILTLSGTAEANSIVKIYDGSTLLGSAIASANGGAWSFATPKLTNGSHALTATATDLAGNTGAASSAVTVTVASTTGAVPSGTAGPIVTENLFLDTGPSSTDTETSNDTLTGKADPNSTITLTEGTQTLGTVKAGATGTWAFAPVGLSNGMHLIVASETNAAGVVGKASINFRFDTTPPTVQSEGPSSADLIGGHGVLHTGSTVVFTMVLTENSMVAGGVPSLSLSNGGTATFDAQHSTPTALVFDYTVAPGQSASSLAVTNVNFNGASVTDVAGNEVNFAGAIKSFAGIIVNAPASAPDMAAPAAPTIMSFLPDTGTVGDGITNATVLTLSGTAEASSTVKIYDGSTLLGTSTADANGTWNFAAAGLANGSHGFTATATDTAGNTGTASAALTVTVDTIAPAAPTIVSFSPDTGTVGDGITNATVLTLSGTTEASSTIKIYDGSTLLGTSTAEANGTWNFAAAGLANGSHGFTATATDLSGNTGAASAALTVTVDTIAPAAPTISSFSPDSGTVGDGITDANILTLSGAAQASSIVQVYDGSTLLGTAFSDGTGAWSFATAKLADGAHNFTAVAIDLVGNISTASSALSVRVDSVAPATPIANVYLSNGNTISNGVTNATALALGGTAEASSNVTIYDGSALLGVAKADASGAWSFATGTLANGVHAFTTTATDAAGNVSAGSSPVTVAVDTVAPTAPTIANSGPTFITAATVLTLTGTAETNSAVKIYDGSTLLGTTMASADGTWSLTTPTLSNGPHTFTGTATDPAGNTSPLSFPLSEEVDTALRMPTHTGAAPAVAPVVTEQLLFDTGVSSTDLATSNDWLTGTADPNSVVTLMEGSKTLGTAATDSTGHWTFQPIGLSNGFHNIIVSETNAAGLTAKAALNFRLDMTAPSIQSEGPSGPGLIGGHGVLHAGNTVVFTEVLTENSIIAGGTPTLKLSDGGIATYDAQHSTPTSLAFDYTVASGEYAPSLSVVGLNLNGAIATDVAGNAVNFAGAIKTFSGLVVDATTPVAAADHSHLATGGTLTTVVSAGVLANDQDVDPFDTLSVSAVNGQAAGVGHSVNGEFGTLTLNADGSYIYHNTNVTAVTALGGVAEDTFIYTASNGHGGHANSTLDIVITSPGQTYVGGVSGGTITGSGSIVLDASAGNVTAIGGTGTQFFVGGPGATLTAGTGPDSFIFAANFGKNTVNNFDTSHDTIEFSKATFANAATVLADAHQVGSDTVITYDAADTITLTHTLLQDLHASNFLLA